MDTATALLLTPEEADSRRLRDLSARSELNDVVFVEMLYLGKWIRFDLSAMEAQYLDAAELCGRYLDPAFKALSLPRNDVGQSSSFTPS